MKNRNSHSAQPFLWAGLTVVFFIGLSWGRYPVSALDSLKVLTGHIGIPINRNWPETLDTVIMQIRLPRVLAAMLIGGSLSVSGASFQGLFRNPLVSPYVLGVASGAGFGAALGILLTEDSLIIQLCAFSFGMFAVGAAWIMSSLYKSSRTIIIILAGVVMGAFFQSLLSLVKYMADPDDKLPVIVYWLMGSLSSVTMTDLENVSPAIAICLLIIYLLRWKINVLTMGEDEARTMGIESGKLRFIIVVAVTVITACSVSISGIIGWVGLVVPHLARMVVGPDFRKLIPASLIMGACYLTLIDGLARNISAAEIPLGILTATVGAPFFALLLARGRTGWS